MSLVAFFRFLVALARCGDLLLCAKDLFFAAKARDCVCAGLSSAQRQHMNCPNTFMNSRSNGA